MDNKSKKEFRREDMTIHEMPLVSVIITTYRRPKMLKRAINSVLDQTYENIEVVVVDDNNPETEGRKETEELMLCFKDFTNVKYIKHPRNMNGAAARNTGIKNSSGEIVSFLDDDDWYLREKIEKQVKYLVANPEYDAVYCGWERDNKTYLSTKEGDLTFGILSGINPVITNTIMMYKDAAIKCGGWDERFKRSQEPVFLLRYFDKGYKMGVVTEKLVVFDISDRSNANEPRKKEETIDFFLKVHEKQIAECDAKIKNGKKTIYSYRYRSVLLSYLKRKDYKGAIKLYIKMMKYIPLKFNKDLLMYTKKKILTKKG